MLLLLRYWLGFGIWLEHEDPQHPTREGWTWCQTNTGSDGSSFSCEVLGLRQLPTQPFAGYVAGNPTGDQCDPNNYTCPSGYRKQADGTCQPIPECPDGVPVDGETGQCTQPQECPTGKVKDANGECVPEKNLCPVGQVKGPDGSCVEDENTCGAGHVKGADGTCKKDEDGDGEPDEEEDPDKHTAEDSPGCDVAPKCSGDQIMCLHAKQLWRIDCNTRKARNVMMDAYCQKPPVALLFALLVHAKLFAALLAGVERATGAVAVILHKPRLWRLARACGAHN